MIATTEIPAHCPGKGRASGNHPCHSEPEAFSAVFDQHAEAALGLALRLTENHALADDAVQESMLRVWHALPSFRPGNMRGWVLRIVAHECLRLLKAGQREKTRVAIAVSFWRRQERDGIDEGAERAELLPALNKAVTTLKARDRQLLELHYEKGLSQRRISAATHVAKQTVSYRLKHIVDGLRSKLAKGDEMSC